MNVFVLLGNYDYEGSQLIGVFESYLDAEEVRNSESEKRGYDSYDIQEVEVGEVIELENRY